MNKEVTRLLGRLREMMSDGMSARQPALPSADLPQQAAPAGSTVRLADLMRMQAATPASQPASTAGALVRTEKKANTFPPAIPGEGLAQYAVRTAAQTGFPMQQLGAFLAAASSSPAGANASFPELVDAFSNQAAYLSEAELSRQNTLQQADVAAEAARSYGPGTPGLGATKADFERLAHAEPFDPQLWRKLPRNAQGQLDVSSVWPSWSTAQRLAAYATGGITGMSRADITDGNDLLARQLVNGTELENHNMSSQPALQGPGPHEIPRLAKGDPATLAMYGLPQKLPATELRSMAEGILHRLNITGSEYTQTLQQWGVV